jgi:hypothetical protein
MKRIRVIGYIRIDDDEYDDGPLGPLTEEANESYVLDLGLEDTQFELAGEA